MENETDLDFRERNQVALDDCNRMIAWYDRKKRIPRNLFYVFQVGAIVLSAIIPILILWDELPKAIQALPAALVSIAVGLNAVFKWRDNWATRAHTAEALKRELMKFQSRTSARYSLSLNAQQALENFVESIDSLTMNEVSEWKNMQIQAAETSK